MGVKPLSFEFAAREFREAMWKSPSAACQGTESPGDGLFEHLGRGAGDVAFVGHDPRASE